MQNRDPESGNALAWYRGISRYQWLVLAICSAGWLFDVFEGQIFVASMREALPHLVGGDAAADDPVVKTWIDRSFAAFLIGGALGGVFFGWLSDKIGRSKTLIFTILFYSVFTCITALATEPVHMVILRFLVAIGVGGEWAVASAMVAEVMPTRSRAIMSSIFHGSSVLGTLLATAVGYFVLAAQPWGESSWKLGFLVGVVPALLIVIIRWKMHEPEAWKEARQRSALDKSQSTGNLKDLFTGLNLRATLVGVTLATIGLITFWGCHIYGKDALLRKAQTQAVFAEYGTSQASKEQTKAAYKTHASAIKKAEMTSMAINTIGGGLGLVLFGWFATKWGRRRAFVFYHVGAAIMVAVMFLWLIPRGASSLQLMMALPLFGFMTLGMHAGYAVYFPELFQTRLRGTGTGFCFNMGRIVSAVYFFFISNKLGGPEKAALLMIPLFLIGVVISLLGRETKDQELPK
jgi:MFS family permease